MTAVFTVPVTVAANDWALPTWTRAVDGVTDDADGGGGDRHRHVVAGDGARPRLPHGELDCAGLRAITRHDERRR